MKNENNISKENKDSFVYSFKQQILTAWQPVPTINTTICLFLLLAGLFLGIGIPLIIYSEQIQEITIRYDNLQGCNIYPSACQTTFNVPNNITDKIYVYYDIENFYQNHRRYVKSRDNDQLAGMVKGPSDLEECDPIIYNRDLDVNVSFGGVALNPNDPANPCGLIAKSFFNDSYLLSYPNGSFVSISETDIAWPSDKKYKFKSPPNATAIQWINVTNEHFMVWMRTSATSSFRKLWGHIDNGLTAGIYTLTISNNFPIQKFSGTKSFVLSTTNHFGGRNTFLAVAYIIVGGCSLFLAVLFLIKKFTTKNSIENYKKSS